VGKGANVPLLTGSDQLSIGNVVFGTGMNTMASAKIAIADDTPDAKLEITASNAATPANTDGILIPRVNAFPVTNPTAAQNGMMIFLTTILGQNVAGFYYWDHAAVNWVPWAAKAVGVYPETPERVRLQTLLGPMTTPPLPCVPTDPSVCASRQPGM
jgi:hypothetical protein